MKSIAHILLLLALLVSSCTEKKEEVEIMKTLDFSDMSLEIPSNSVDESLLHYNNKTSLWTLNGELYSGYFTSYYKDNTPKEKVGILNGKKQNQAVRWYPDGRFQQVTHYHQGKLHGEKKTWSSDSSHVLMAQLDYYLGKAHGVQKQWYPTGEIHKKLNLNMGREEGIQQAYRKNGELYANYEAKNGRTFGLKKASLCYGLDDENIEYNE